MTENELIILNLEEIRRRSILLWQGLPEAFYDWKPDPEAMTASGIIQHVLGADYGWHKIVTNTMDLSAYASPWQDRRYSSLSDELAFAAPYRQELLNSIRRFSPAELSAGEVLHPGTGKKRNLADYLLRIGYHESVHAGQFLSYLRAMKVDRPFIWD